MLVTEAAARLKRCVTVSTRCSASQCMAWRFNKSDEAQPEIQTFWPDEVIPEAQLINEPALRPDDLLAFDGEVTWVPINLTDPENPDGGWWEETHASLNQRVAGWKARRRGYCGIAWKPLGAVEL